MKNFLPLFLIILTLLFASTAMADWRGDFTFTPDTSETVEKYQLLMDGAVVVDDVDQTTGAVSYVVPAVAGQSFVLRCVAANGTMADSDPIIAVMAPKPGGFTVHFLKVE